MGVIEWILLGGLVLIVALIIVWPSIHVIGPTEVGLVIKRFSFKKLKIVPDILVTGGGGAVEGLAGALMKFLTPKK